MRIRAGYRTALPATPSVQRASAIAETMGCRDWSSIGRMVEGIAGAICSIETFSDGAQGASVNRDHRARDVGSGWGE